MLDLNLYPDLGPFVYGVASGDPTQDSVLIWTALEEEGDVVAEISYVVWEESGSVVSEGFLFAKETNDFTTTQEITDLTPGTKYFYQFTLLNASKVIGVSVIGETKTLPSTTDHFKVASISCSSIYSGYLHAYRDIALDSSIDLVIHLGDYIYPETDSEECHRVPNGVCASSYEFSKCQRESEDRLSQTLFVSNFANKFNCSMTDLQSKRWTHKLYHLDPDLREARRKHPFIVIWDNHDLKEEQERAYVDGIKAFVEHVPIRHEHFTDTGVHIHRMFTVGEDFMHIFALDTYIQTNESSLLGRRQEEWLSQSLMNSSEPNWRILSQQKVIMPISLNKFPVEFFVFGICILFIQLWIVLSLKICNFIMKTEIKTKVDRKNENKFTSTLAPRISCYNKSCWCASLFILLLTLAGTIVLTIVLNPGNIIDLNSSSRSWGGDYPALNKLFSLLVNSNSDKNNVFFGGDTHFTILADVFTFNGQDYDSISCYSNRVQCEDSHRLGVEIISSSASRGNIDETVKGILGFESDSVINGIFSAFIQNGIKRGNPHFRNFDGMQHGYAVVDFFEDSLRTEVKYFNILEKNFNKSKEEGIFRTVKRSSNKWN